MRLQYFLLVNEYHTCILVTYYEIPNDSVHRIFIGNYTDIVKSGAFFRVQLYEKSLPLVGFLYYSNDLAFLNENAILPILHA